MTDFARRLVAWQRRAGRNDLPWQNTRDPYRIWLSEIMLQQTQVKTVIPYFTRFVARFPDVAALARAKVDEVMRLWSGLGYYSRARNLHAAACAVVDRHGGRFPAEREALSELPGIGRSTAAAIAAFAFGRREAILDGNVKRVLARHFTEAGGERALWTLAESLLPARGIERYTQALMDLGAMICTVRDPSCTACPVRASCRARDEGAIERYPARRVRAAVPLRRTTMLVLMRGDEVMLERRPPAGIWGALWCFPEASDEGDAIAQARNRFGCEVRVVARLPTVKHGFTHFKLDIDPVLAHAERATRAAEPGAIWLTIDEARAAPLPVPAKRILEQLAAPGALARYFAPSRPRSSRKR